MRVHNPSKSEDNSNSQDHALFWPIGQEIVADLIRALLDDYSTKETLNKDEVLEALAPLRHVDWSLHNEPWKHLLLVQTSDKAGNISWTMRNEGRNVAIDIAKQVLFFIVGLTPLNEEDLEVLRNRWAQGLALLPGTEVDTATMWQEVVAQATATSDHTPA